MLGFNAEMSHRIVDMRECHILRPELFALVEPLRRLLAGMLQPKRAAEVQLTLIDGGVDVTIKGVPAGRLDRDRATDVICHRSRACPAQRRSGLGPGDAVRAATGHRDLVGRAGGISARRVPSGDAGRRGGAGRCSSRRRSAGRLAVADLFAGLGTFALAARASYAAEASRDAAAALKQAAPRINVEHRDLYRAPLDAQGAEARSTA